MSEQKVNLKPYKYTVNGIQYFDVTPDYNVSNQYTPASVEELQGEIGRYQGKTDEWSQNYLQSLQSGLSKIQSGSSPYVLNEKGVLATQQEVAAQKAQREAMASGRDVALGGTLDALLTVPKGTPTPQEANRAFQATLPPPKYEEFQTRHQAAKDAGVQAPSTYEGATSMFNQFPASQQGTSALDNFVTQDPNLNSTIRAYQDYMGQQNQRTSLVEEYKSLLKTSCIEAIDMKLINIKKVIEGTEDDIRTEVTKAGGFATDSQVIALSNARNKQLIKNYNTLLETRNSKSQYLDTMMNLTQQDRQEADRIFETKMNFGFKIAEINQQMKQNAISTIDRVAQTLGWDGIEEATRGNPQLITQIERTYGLPTGGLSIAAQRAAQARAFAQQERELALEGKAGQKKQQEFENKLALDKFEEDKRKFGLQYALDKQKEARLGAVKDSEITGDNKKPLSVLDLARFQELYPDAGITAGDTEASAIQKVQKLSQPRAFSKAELTTAIQEDKTAKTSYEEVIAGIDANLLISNKDEAKKVATNVYGKKEPLPEGQTTRVAEIKKTYTSRSFYEPIPTIIDSISDFLFKPYYPMK